MYRHCNTYWPMLPHVFDYTGYTMSTRCHHYVSIRTSATGNYSSHHRCNTLHQCTLPDQYVWLTFHRLNNVQDPHCTGYYHRGNNTHCRHRGCMCHRCSCNNRGHTLPSLYKSMMQHCTNRYSIGYRWLMNCHTNKLHYPGMSAVYTHAYNIYNTRPTHWNCHSQTSSTNHPPNHCTTGNCFQTYKNRFCNCLRSKCTLTTVHCTNNHHSTGYRRLMNCHACNCMPNWGKFVVYNPCCNFYNIRSDHRCHPHCTDNWLDKTDNLFHLHNDYYQRQPSLDLFHNWRAYMFHRLH